MIDLCEENKRCERMRNALDMVKMRYLIVPVLVVLLTPDRLFIQAVMFMVYPISIHAVLVSMYGRYVKDYGKKVQKDLEDIQDKARRRMTQH